jgi:putative redox protein
MPPRQTSASISARHLLREQVHVVMGQHSLVMDHPPSYDGDGLGPAPIEVLLGAVAGCKAVTVVRYARRKGYPLQSVEVRIPSYTIDHVKAEGPSHALVWLTKVEATLDLRGDLTNEQRRELAWVAEHCPVSETLLRGAAIEQRTAGAPA